MTDSVYWIWFQQVFGIGTRRAELMMNYFTTPKEIFDGATKDPVITGMLTPREKESSASMMEQAKIIQARTLKKGCDIITPEHAAYPAALQEIYAKPAVLYVKGDLSCLTQKIAVAMVGTRKHSAYGESTARMLAEELAACGIVVVSGLAKGIDTICHHAALEVGGKTIGVMGCGIDIDYPNGNAPLKTKMAASGAVMTEFPLGTPPRPGNFPVRNRIISGISRGTVVVEADEQSGSMLTAMHAMEQGRDVFAVPGDIFADKMQGNLALIRDGAKMVTQSSDVLEEYGLHIEVKKQAKLHIPATLEENSIEPVQKSDSSRDRKIVIPEAVSESGKLVYQYLAGQVLSADELARKSKLEIAQLHTALTELEIYQLVESLPGRRFACKT